MPAELVGFDSQAPRHLPSFPRQRSIACISSEDPARAPCRPLVAPQFCGKQLFFLLLVFCLTSPSSSPLPPTRFYTLMGRARLPGGMQRENISRCCLKNLSLCRRYPAAEYTRSPEDGQLQPAEAKPPYEVLWCPVDPYPPDLDEASTRHPNFFRGASPLRCTVTKGEILYLPRFAPSPWAKWLASSFLISSCHGSSPGIPFASQSYACHPSSLLRSI